MCLGCVGVRRLCLCVVVGGWSVVAGRWWLVVGGWWWSCVVVGGSWGWWWGGGVRVSPGLQWVGGRPGAYVVHILPRPAVPDPDPVLLVLPGAPWCSYGHGHVHQHAGKEPNAFSVTLYCVDELFESRHQDFLRHGKGCGGGGGARWHLAGIVGNTAAPLSTTPFRTPPLICTGRLHTGRLPALRVVLGFSAGLYGLTWDAFPPRFCSSTLCSNRPCGCCPTLCAPLCASWQPSLCSRTGSTVC
jgi:hypothetical protein